VKRFIKLIVMLLILVALSATHLRAADGIPFVKVGGSINTSMVVDNKIRTIPLPYGHAIAEGIISGHDGLNKFGANANVGTTEELIWTASNGRAYLTAAETLQVSSADADDTSAGTGARTILLTGQTTGYVEITETVTMNGATPVETTNSFLRIYRVQVITAGSSGANEGLISVKDNANTNQLAEVVAGRGQSEMAFWTVPAGKTAFIAEVFVGEAANKRCTIRLYARDNTVTDAAWQFKTAIDVNAASEYAPFFIPLVFTEKTDIRFLGQAASLGADVNVRFGLYYED
jgi:hypothetical protein